jgi:hypothetical protein
MKQRILTVFVALVSAFFFIKLSPATLQNGRLAWINWDSLTGKHSFYFKKRQWLADVRTIAAGVRYLYEDRMAGQNRPMDVVKAASSPPTRLEVSTNHLGSNGTGSSSPVAAAKLSKFRAVICPIQSLSFAGLPSGARSLNFHPLAPAVWHGPVWRQSVFSPWSEHAGPGHSQASST